MMVLDTNNHSVFLLKYHLILLIYNKDTIITNDISERLKSIFEKISPNFNINLKEWCNNGYYLHITFKACPNSILSRFVNSYKSTSSNLIKKDFDIITSQLKNNKFWDSGYLLYSSGEISNEIINDFVNNPKKRRTLLL